MDYAAHIPQRFDLYIFDLDGTLIDSLDDLTAAMNVTLVRYGYAPVDRETVRRAIGNGARNLVRTTFSAASRQNPEELVATVEAALPEYREEYAKRCTDKTVLYPGMREWLEALKRQGARLAVLTNKPEDQALCILKALGAADFFTCIIGPESVGTLKPDPAGLTLIMEKTGVPADRTILIGDSSVDIHTARNAGIASCGITGGIGDDEALRALMPEYLIERTEG
jgi:phosphoglycolate phosphatase